MAERTVDSFAEGRSRVVLETSAAVFVRGDESWLGRAIANLVDNALSHSERDSPARVSVRREEGWVRIAVKSQGAVPIGIGPRLFRRFVTSRGERGGNRHWVAIVRAVAEAHAGARAGAGRSSGSGIRLVARRMALPRGAAA